ncbi:hypothetical protein Agub_g11119, partial [Astrephomene gubernaculifera]
MEQCGHQTSARSGTGVDARPSDPAPSDGDGDGHDDHYALMNMGHRLHISATGTAGGSGLADNGAAALGMLGNGSGSAAAATATASDSHRPHQHSSAPQPQQAQPQPRHQPHQQPQSGGSSVNVSAGRRGSGSPALLAEGGCYTLPLLALEGVVLLPGCRVPLLLHAPSDLLKLQRVLRAGQQQQQAGPEGSPAARLLAVTHIHSQTRATCLVACSAEVCTVVGHRPQQQHPQQHPQHPQQQQPQQGQQPWRRQAQESQPQQQQQPQHHPQQLLQPAAQPPGGRATEAMRGGAPVQRADTARGLQQLQQGQEQGQGQIGWLHPTRVEAGVDPQLPGDYTGSTVRHSTAGNPGNPGGHASGEGEEQSGNGGSGSPASSTAVAAPAAPAAGLSPGDGSAGEGGGEGEGGEVAFAAGVVAVVVLGVQRLLLDPASLGDSFRVRCRVMEEG